jgi:hypothetical protein
VKRKKRGEAPCHIPAARSVTNICEKAGDDRRQDSEASAGQALFIVRTNLVDRKQRDNTINDQKAVTSSTS